MVLAYIDESGTNFSQDENGYFHKDGPYVLWCCILVSEKKYLDIERAFQEIAKKYLKTKAAKKELHATDIWKMRVQGDRETKAVSQYFEELIQFTSKMHMPIFFGIQQKNPITPKNKKKLSYRALTLDRARNSLLTLVEHKLAEIDEAAILVSDEEMDKKLKTLVFERTKWRYCPPGSSKLLSTPRFRFEFQSNFILDQLHYVDSKTSLLMQYTDNMCFIFRKCLEHLYLLNFPKPGIRPVADIKHLPISETTFNAFLQFCKVEYAHFDDKINDVTMGRFDYLQEFSYAFEKFSTGAMLITPRRMITQDMQILREITPFQ